MTPRTSAAVADVHSGTTTGRRWSYAGGAQATGLRKASIDDELLQLAIAWVKEQGLDGAEFLSTVGAVFEMLKEEIGHSR